MKPIPDHAALILVDVQEGFGDGSWGPRNSPDAEMHIAALLHAWRGTRRPVIHVHHTSLSPSGSFREGMPSHAPKSEGMPIQGEPVYGKIVNSAFIGTSLACDLQGNGIETLVIVGLTTNHCVSTTTPMAGNLGFSAYVVSDATASFDGVHVHGCRRAAQDVHVAALSDLKGESAEIVETAAVLAALRAPALSLASG